MKVMFARQRLSDMERMATAMLAGASEINSELTVALSGVDEMLHADDVSDNDLAELRQALQQITWKVASLASYARGKGARPVPITVERLMAEG